MSWIYLVVGFVGGVFVGWGAYDWWLCHRIIREDSPRDNP